MNEGKRYVPCPICTANRPRLCDLHYQHGAEAFLQAVKHAIADPLTPDGVKATYEELLAQNRSLAARVQAVERENAAIKATVGDTEFSLRQQLADMTRERDEQIEKLREISAVHGPALMQINDLTHKLAEAQGMVAKLQNDPDYQQCCELRKQAEQQVARLQEALRFYADPHTYGLNGGTNERIIKDRGQQAQQALKGA